MSNTKKATELPLKSSLPTIIGLAEDGTLGRMTNKSQFEGVVIENPNLNELLTPGIYYAVNHTENLQGAPSSGTWRYVIVEVFKAYTTFQRITSVTDWKVAVRTCNSTPGSWHIL